MPTNVEIVASIPPINPETLRNLLRSNMISPWMESFLRCLHPDGNCCEECVRRVTDIIDGYGLSYRANRGHPTISLSNLYDDMYYRHTDQMNRIFVRLVPEYRNFLYGLHQAGGINAVFACQECCNRLRSFSNGDSYFAFENVNSTTHGLGIQLTGRNIREYAAIHTAVSTRRQRQPDRDMGADAERAVSSGHQEKTIV